MRHLLITLLLSTILSLSAFSENTLSLAFKKFQTRQHNSSVELCKKAVLKEELSYADLAYAFKLIQINRHTQGFKNTSELDLLLKQYHTANKQRPLKLINTAKIYKHILVRRGIHKGGKIYYKIEDFSSGYNHHFAKPEILEIKRNQLLFPRIPELDFFFQTERNKLNLLEDQDNIAARFENDELSTKALKFTITAKRQDYDYLYAYNHAMALETMLSIKGQIKDLDRSTQIFYWQSLVDMIHPSKKLRLIDSQKVLLDKVGYEYPEKLNDLPTYKSPKSFEEAKSEGERWKYCLDQLAKLSPKAKMEADYKEAFYLASLTRDLNSNTNFYTQSSIHPKIKSRRYELMKSLSDNETIIDKKVIVLAKEQNYLKMLHNLVDKGQLKAHWLLAHIYLNREQRPRAVKLLEQSLKIKDYPATKIALKHIQGNWGTFIYTDANMKDNKVKFISRNSPSVKVKIHTIDTKKLFETIQQTYNNSLGSKQTIPFDLTLFEYRTRVDPVKKIDFIKRFITESTHREIEISKSARHQEVVQDLDLGLEDGKAYLLEAEVPNGNKTASYVYLPKNSIVAKRLNSGLMIYVCDRQTGDIVSNADITLWAYYLDNNNDYDDDLWHHFGDEFERNYNDRPYFIFSRRFELKTNSKGLAFISNEHLKSLKNARLFFSSFKDNDFDYCTGENLDLDNNRFGNRDTNPFTKYIETDYKNSFQEDFVIIDKPIYKPGETVNFKIIFNYQNLEIENEKSPKYHVRISNPNWKRVLEKDFPITSKTNSISGSYQIPVNAKLGKYEINDLEFYVEEYRAPKFTPRIKILEDNRKDKKNIKIEITATYPDGKRVQNITGDATLSLFPELDKDYVKDKTWAWLYRAKYGRSFSNYSPYANTSHYRQSFYSDRYNGFSEFSYQDDNKPLPKIKEYLDLKFNKNGIAVLELSSEKLDTLNTCLLSAQLSVRDQTGEFYHGSSAINLPQLTELYDLRSDKNFYFSGEDIQLHLDSSSNKKQSKEFTLKSKDYSKKIQLENNSSITLKGLKSGEYTVEDKLSFIILDKNNSLRKPAQDLSILTEKQSYNSSEKSAKVLLSSKFKDAKVLLISQPSSFEEYPSFYKTEKSNFVRLIELKGHSQVLDLNLASAPNHNLVAIMVRDKDFYELNFNIPILPKEELKVDLKADKETYQNGETATVKIKLNSKIKKPVIALTVYDQNLENIGGSLSSSPSIYKHFWSWLYRYQLNSTTNTIVQPMWVNGVQNGIMSSLGLFNKLLIPNFQNQNFLSSDYGKLLWSKNYFNLADGDFGSDDFDDSESFGGEIKTALAQKFNSYIREKFNDSVYWNANIIPDQNGEATIKFKLPDTLSTWKIKAWLIDTDLSCGESETTIVTTKNLSLRTNPPRFLIESDEILYSAQIKNSTQSAHEITSAINLSEELILDHSPAEQIFTVAPMSEVTVSWKLKAIKEGNAEVSLFAKGANDSDAIKERFPVKIYGTLKQDSTVGNTERLSKLDLNVASDAKLELTITPSIASALIESLPYLITYPHGCAEQTLNRFIPAIQLKNFCDKEGLDLSKIKLIDKTQNIAFSQFEESSTAKKQYPNFKAAMADKMVADGLKKLFKTRTRYSGWPWFSSRKGSPYITALVLNGLQKVEIKNADYINKIDESLVYLRRMILRYSFHNKNYTPDELNAEKLFIYYVLVQQSPLNHKELNEGYFKIRHEMNTYSRCLMALTFMKLGEKDKAQIIFNELKKQLVINKELNQAHLHVAKAKYWYWYNNEVETQAYFLKLLCELKDQSELPEQVTQYLLNKRKLSGHWSSTRNTAIAIDAILTFLEFKKESLSNKSVDLIIDGQKIKSFDFTKENWLGQKITLNNLKAGQHKLELQSNSKAYFTAQLSYFSREKKITDSGQDIKVQREYYRVKTESKIAEFDEIIQKEVFELIEENEELKSGELIEVQIKLSAVNDYEYILVSDPKAANFKTVLQKSTHHKDHHREYRNSSVNCYFEHLNRGEHTIKYRVRVNNKGTFNALPTLVEAMYTPQIKANSSNKIFKVK